MALTVSIRLQLPVSFLKAHHLLAAKVLKTRMVAAAAVPARRAKLRLVEKAFRATSPVFLSSMVLVAVAADVFVWTNPLPLPAATVAKTPATAGREHRQTTILLSLLQPRILLRHTLVLEVAAVFRLAEVQMMAILPMNLRGVHPARTELSSSATKSIFLVPRAL